MDEQKDKEKTDEEKKEEVVSVKAFLDEGDGYHEFGGPAHIRHVQYPTLKRWLGFVIQTNKQAVRVLIEHGTKCCEHYRAFATRTNAPEVEFDVETFLKPGTIIQSVRMLEKASFQEYSYSNIYNELSVEIRTKGKPLLRLVLQCDHNGYYPHDTHIEWDGFKDDTQKL